MRELKKCIQLYDLGSGIMKLLVMTYVTIYSNNANLVGYQDLDFRRTTTHPHYFQKKSPIIQYQSVRVSSILQWK